MGSFYPIATPPHRATELRIACEHEGGRTGRYRLHAYKGERHVVTQCFEWNVWLGHNCGNLLVDKFIDHAEIQPFTE